MTGVIIVSIIAAVLLIYLFAMYKRTTGNRAFQYLTCIALCVMWFIALASVFLDEKLSELSNQDGSLCKCECPICAKCLNKD